MIEAAEQLLEQYEQDLKNVQARITNIINSDNIEFEEKWKLFKKAVNLNIYATKRFMYTLKGFTGDIFDDFYMRKYETVTLGHIEDWVNEYPHKFAVTREEVLMDLMKNGIGSFIIDW